MAIEKPERGAEKLKNILNPNKNEVLDKIWDILPALPFEYGPLTLPIPRTIAKKIYKERRR